MIEIKDYFCGIDYFNDALMVKVKYPKQVNAIGNDELGIKVTKGEDDIVYYYGNKKLYELSFDISSKEFSGGKGTPNNPYLDTNITEITILVIHSTQAPTLVSLKCPAAKVIDE